MRRRTLIGLALFVLLVAGGLAGAQVGGEPTVATHTETFEHVVTYTIPTETVRETTTVVSTETVTVTTETEPPLPTTTVEEPPPDPEGTVLEFTDRQFRCTPGTIETDNGEVGGTISGLAVNGLPLRVVLDYTGPFVPRRGGGAMWIGQGCDGDGDPGTVDLILDVRGDGLTYGPGDDAVRIANASPGPQNLVVSGRADCGPRVGAAHADGVQVLGGRNITFLDFEVGDYDAGRATCQGAGGAFFYSLASENVDVQGGKFIACNHGLLAGSSSPGAEVRDARFRTGPDTAICAPYHVSAPCIVESDWGGVTSGLMCQRWRDGTWVDE